MSLTVASLLAVHAPASAGLWDPSYTYSGTTTWTVDGQPQGSKAWTSDPTTWTNTSANWMRSATTQSHGTVTATITWQPAFNGDPAPTQVMVKQSAEAKYTWATDGPPASASGSTSNGLGSPEMYFPTIDANSQTTGATGTSGGCKTLTFTVPAGATPSITLPGVSLNAQTTATASGGAGPVGRDTIGTLNSVYVNCKYTATGLPGPIHAHPVNFHEDTTRRSNANGIPHYEYFWLSSDGVLAHLSTVYIGEVTDYEGNSQPPCTYYNKTHAYSGVPALAWGYFGVPKPPYGLNGMQANLQNPAIGGTMGHWDTAETGGIADNLYPPPFLPPYNQNTIAYTAHQVYGFRCNTCMGSEPPSYFEVLLNTGAITRTFAPNGNGWLYTVTKSGYSGTINK